MKWTGCAMQDLRDYRALRESKKNLSDKIQTLNLKMQSTKGFVTDSTPVKGGGNKTTDSILDSIVERDRLMENYKIVARRVEAIDRGLNALSQKEKLVLDTFYINRPDDYISRLMEILHCERSTVYREKDEALRIFTISMYGLIDS